jgi:diacylglycerol kinase (ATP)
MNLNNTQTKKFIFIINGKRLRNTSVMDRLKKKNYSEAEFHITRYKGHAEELGRGAVDQNCTHIVAVGGDGTIHEVINGMLSSANYARIRPMFTFLPKGSGNDLARSLGYSSSIEALEARLERHEVMLADVGTVHYNQQEKMRYFINVMDFGLGGSIAKKVDQYRRNSWSALAYQRGILLTLPFYKKHHMRVTAGDATFEGPALSVIIANGAWFGGGLGIAPDASMKDGQLNIVIIGDVGMLHYLYYLPRILRAQRITHPNVHYLTGREITIDGSEIPSELDGEVGNSAPVHVGILPNAIAFLV